MLISESYNVSATQSGDVKLTVHTGDEAAEIFIIDSQFHRVAKRVGEKAEFKLSRGLYTVKVRTGAESQEQPAVLFEDATVTFAPIKFNSPTPLLDTAQIHDFHVEYASRDSRSIHKILGEGSQLYVFAREWTSAERPADPAPFYPHPATGLMLKDQSGLELVDFTSPEFPHASGWDPCAGATIQLNPGQYRLCLQTAVGDVLEQTIVTSPGWQTQVFLLQRDYGKKEPDRRADLPNASVFMARIGQGFKPATDNIKRADTPDFRLAEIARQALLDGRQVITPAILKRILSEKFGNPMLGIYGAHILLLAQEPNLETLKIIVKNLRDLLITPHPDVEALALRAGEGSEYVFEMPPMLRPSWSLVLKASIQQPNLVPTDSLTSNVAGRLWSDGLWFLWTQPSTDNSQCDDILRNQLKQLLQPDGSSAAAPSQMIVSTGSETPPESDDVQERSLALPEFETAPMAYNSLMKTELDEAEIIRLVQTLGIPRGKLDAFVKSL